MPCDNPYNHFGEALKPVHEIGGTPVLTADARQLPFADDTFDVVVSHWVVHNMDKPSDRLRVLDEMARVLKPGGWLLIADIENHSEYVSRLKALGFIDVRYIVSRFWDQVRALITFRTFRPGTVIGRSHDFKKVSL